MADLALLHSPWVQALGLALLHSLWQVTLLAAIYLAVGSSLLRHSAAARVRLGELCVLASLAWPALNLFLWLGPQQSLQAASARAAGVMRDMLPMADAAVAALPWTSWIALAWGVGVTLLAARAARHGLALRRIARDARPLGAPWAERMAEWCQRTGLRRPVQWLESADVDTPMMFGWLKPVVLFPLGLAMRLPVDQAELLMLHELAHIRRMDGLGNILQVIAETLLFFHPALRWMSRRMRHDRELACDQAVSVQPERRVRYARALLAVAEFRREHQVWATAASGGVLRERVENLFEPGIVRLEPRRSFAWLLALACASIGLVQWSVNQTGMNAPLPLQAVARTVYHLSGVMPPSLPAQRFGLDVPKPAMDEVVSGVRDRTSLPAPLPMPGAAPAREPGVESWAGEQALPAAPSDIGVSLRREVQPAAPAGAAGTDELAWTADTSEESYAPGLDTRACRPRTGSRLCRERGDWQAESNKVTVIVPAR